MAERKRKRSLIRSHSPTFCPPLLKSVRTETVTYRNGAIRRIVLHKFLTFDDVEVYPSPQLNVIVGPNGTGKSSLVCAMCIGLAGSTTILGRARDLKDFVKHGSAREGYIEITLHHSGGNHPTIRREINKDRNSSKWLINGQEKRECEVMQLVKDFNIQLENKCQFLPQDKVVEFAKLDCYQMLEETEKAIGTNNMFELHQKLKTMKDKKLDIERSLGGQRKDLEILKRENQLLERDVIRIRTGQECLTKVKYLKWKKCWLEYDEARLRYQESRSTRKEKESQRRVIHDRYEPLKEKLRSKEAIVQNFQKIEKDQSNKVCNIERKLSEKQRELVDLQDEQDATGKEYDNKKHEEANRLKKISRLQGEIESFTREMEGLEPAEFIYPRMKSIDTQLQKFRHQMNAIQSRQQILYEEKQLHQQHVKNAEEELHKMEDVFNQRLKKLDMKDHHTFVAIQWLKENKDMFEKPVHQPVIVMLHIKELKYAPQIEQFFMGKDAFSFIFESKKDYDTFAHEVRDKKNLKVNMVLAPNKRLQEFKCVVPLHVLRQFGFKHMLINLVEAPEAVLSYFCTYYRLHDVPVADEAQVARFVDAHHSIQRFYTGDQVYFVTRSRYSSKTITKSVHVRECTFFVSTVNEVERATLLSDIKEATDKISALDQDLSQLQQTELDLRQQDGNCRRVKNDLKEVLNNRARLKRSRESKQIQMQQLQNSPINIEIESHKYKESLINLISKKTQCLEKVSQYTKAYHHHLIAKSHAFINFTEADLHKKNFESQFESITNELKDAEFAVNQAKEDEVNTKECAHHLMDIARRVTGFKSPNELSPETAAMFQGLPNDLSSIEDQIHENQTQADMCSDVHHDGEAIIKQFETRDAKIRELESLVEVQGNKLQNHEEETEKLKRQWLEPLQAMMEDINSRFSHFFSLMDCTGEVSLSSHDYDFSKYGVQIRVKFRSEDELHVLDAHRQSGGERSVSTMMYLMALQDITSCPFRVVDEINQGMDSANERRVFDLIVDTVCQTDTSQYFLLTPKLLQDLKYSSCVSVHFVHNGPELMHHTKWSY